MRGALASVIMVTSLTLSSCLSFSADDKSHRGYGPPPHAPAYGYRHHHQGARLAFDSKLGVYVVLSQNEDDWFLIRVDKTSCGLEECAGMGGYDRYSVEMDQNPCGGPGENDCEDNTTTFYVQVYTEAPTGQSCRDFTLQITNG